jgi:hypothetical protein
MTKPALRELVKQIQAKALALPGTIIRHDKPSRSDLHPTMKPIALIEEMVEASSREGEIVLDPFGGSGSTLIACEKLNRRAALIELDPHYADVIIARWQAFTERQASLGETCKTFEQVSLERAGEAHNAEVDEADAATARERIAELYGVDPTVSGPELAARITELTGMDELSTSQTPEGASAP